MQHLPGLAWVKDSQGRYAYANDAAVKAFRHPRNDLYGKTDADLFPAKTAVQFQENDVRVLASGAGSVEAVAGSTRGYRHYRPEAGRGDAS